MNASFFLTKDLLATVQPRDVEAYLSSAGWRREDQIKDKAAIWVPGDDVPDLDVELMVPLRQTLVDYTTRLGQVLLTLQDVERRSVNVVYQDITTPLLDVVDIRVSSPSAADGSMPLKAGATLYESAYDMMLYAACSVVKTKPAYVNSKPTRAVEFANRLKMGQTQVGSYIVTIINRVPRTGEATLETAEGLHLELMPFERRVTQRLVNALEATETASRQARETNTLAPFVSAVGDGASANLYRALRKIHEAGDNHGVELGFRWAPDRPPHRPLPKKLVLGPETMAEIRKAERYFFETTPVDEFLMIGVVTGLRRAEGASEGTVNIYGVVNGRARTVIATLPSELYAVAREAHSPNDNHKAVACRGELVKEGRNYRLQNVTSFTPVDSSTLFAEDDE